MKAKTIRPLFAMTIVASLALCGPTSADGLIQQLPKDSSWALFRTEAVKDATQQGGPLKHYEGSLKISSVGTVTVNGEKCRWIEIERTYRQRNEPISDERGSVFKVLIAEAQLQKGGTPLDHVQRGWIAGLGRFGNLGPREIRGVDGMPVPKSAFEADAQFLLDGPSADARPLEPALIESKLGKLTCAGLAGRIDTSALPRADNRPAPAVTFEIRLHKDAPFGFVSHTMKLVEPDGRVVESKATLEDFGTTATSRLPECK